MKQELEQEIARVVQTLFGVDAAVDLTRPDAQFGDFATNIALVLSKQVQKSPREVAESIVAELSSSDNIEAVEIAGPGFINLRVSQVVIGKLIDEKPAKLLTGRTVLVEYSDPNPFKPLHAGHLYTTLVGDSIARLIERAGAKTIRLNYGGDVGLHVARCMWAIIKLADGQDALNARAALEYVHSIENESLHEKARFLGSRYTSGNEAYETDEEAKQQIIEINKQVYDLHIADDHESEFAQIYWTCREWSYEYFKMLYSELQVHEFDRFIPESEVTQLGVKTVREQLANGVYKENDGAVIYDGESQGLHTRVFINSAGLPTYETKDVGLILTKWADYHFDDSIMITANEQSQYFEVMLHSVANFAPEPAKRTRHLSHGVVKLQGGVKMSSRKGNIVTALDIIQAARDAATDTKLGANEETVLAAIKYAFAKVRVGGDIAYDPVESIALEGNSGPYLQYAHARARSILRKVTVAAEESSSEYLDDERTLALKLGEYSEAVNRATTDYMPHHICTYLYELAQTFNRFYEKNRVVGDEREAHRAALVARYADVLQNGLELLGIHAPDKM
jgi:arginyl-tRNA synthetase